MSPLVAALLVWLLDAAQVLLDAGADVNGLTADGVEWPLGAVALGCSDAGMSWLLEHGASLAVANRYGRTVAHVLAAGPTLTDVDDVGRDTRDAGLRSRWLRRLIAAEPSLLEARDEEGQTPLMAAAREGSEACVATLLELGADIGATDADGRTALSRACSSTFVPVVRQLIAAGAASAAVLPPGSRQARGVATAAVVAALRAERGCGECAARCGGDHAGNCADGLDILRAVLAAGVREAVDGDGYSLALRSVVCIRLSDATVRISGEHALTVLQTLHAGGVDVLARGSMGKQTVLNGAAAANAPALVRWLAAEPGAPLEERDSRGNTPLLTACEGKAWAAAHVLLDCGARADVQSTDAAGGAWPALLVAKTASCADGCALLQRLLAADSDSLLRRAADGSTATHVAATADSSRALRLLLGSGLPHLAEAINAVATFRSSHKDTAGMRVTPLHAACYVSNWDAALALLAAGARVDIAGDIDDRFQTLAQWARSSSLCKHRGVKLAVAARAREHAAQAARAAAGSVHASASLDGASILSQSTAHARAGNSGAASYSAAVPAAAGAGAAAGAVVSSAGNAPSAAAVPAGGAGQRAAARKRGRVGAARNRAEEWFDEGAAPAAAAALPVVAAAPTADAAAFVTDSVQTSETGAVATRACPSACGTVAAAGAVSRDLSDSTASTLSAANLPEEPSAGCVPAPSAANLPEEPSAECAPESADPPQLATAL
jgi:ankyrin repeat protein